MSGSTVVLGKIKCSGDIFSFPHRVLGYCPTMFWKPTFAGDNRFTRLRLNAVGSLFLGALLLGFSVFAADVQRSEMLRPFYVIGHGANTLAQAREYLGLGANALEVDVNLMADDTNALCIGHGPSMGAGAAEKDHSVPLAKFLRGLHEIGRTNNLCLVYFDCKTLAATPEHGAALLQAIRTCLVGEGADRIEVLALISVGKLKEKAMFDKIAGQLGPREALMVDGYSDPVAVSGYFSGANVTNQAFCDGIVPVNTFMSQFTVAPAVREACRLRDEQHRIRFVGTWSVNNPFWLRKYIHMGVDGIVVDRGPVWYNFCWVNWGHGLNSLTRLVNNHGGELGIRPATRADNPFAVQQPVFTSR